MQVETEREWVSHRFWFGRFPSLSGMSVEVASRTVGWFLRPEVSHSALRLVAGVQDVIAAPSSHFSL